MDLGSVPSEFAPAEGGSCTALCVVSDTAGERAAASKSMGKGVISGAIMPTVIAIWEPIPSGRVVAYPVFGRAHSRQLHERFRYKSGTLPAHEYCSCAQQRSPGSRLLQTLQLQHLGRPRSAPREWCAASDTPPLVGLSEDRR